MDFSNYLAETKKIGVERRLDAYGVQCGRCDELYAFAATSSVTTMLLYLLTMGPKVCMRALLLHFLCVYFFVFISLSRVARSHICACRLLDDRSQKDVLRRRREALFSESFDFIGIACTEHPVVSIYRCPAAAVRTA